ncbi:MAG: membrane protein insertase YidC, partial [Elusimicrobia bacterium]|nr:membrane protein insertase YidC [Elusimicrobiota bacterium]
PAAETPAAARETAGRAAPETFEASGVTVRIQPYGAGIVGYEYPGPLDRVELVADPAPGYFASWPEVRFKSVGSDPAKPVFEGELPGGVTVRKEYDLGTRDGMKTLRVTFENRGRKPARVEPWKLAMGPGLGTVATEQKENDHLWRAVALLPPPAGKKRADYEEYKPNKEPSTLDGKVLWAGVSNRFFLAAAFPDAKDFDRVVRGDKAVSTMTTSFFGFGGLKKGEVLEPWIRLEAKGQTLPPGGSASIALPFYFGPKGYSHLESLDRGLERSISFGWFHRLGLLTLRVLEVFHRWTGNWGWAIILLTLCLQSVMLPLSWKQMKSMAGMKKVQPELARIQQKFSKDPQRLQQEMMEVYRKNGVNPLGGCLPMLIQMPIFIALFNMLRGAWELHGQPWMFWITDLSAHDPYYVLPLVMGGVMFAQNKLNPQPVADPAQQQMMTIMPVIFTFMFLHFPSGLVLYWLTNSLVGFGAQLLFRKKLAS